MPGIRNYYSKRRKPAFIDFNFSPNEVQDDGTTLSPSGAVAVIKSPNIRDRPEVFYCDKCEKRGVSSPLGPRILDTDEIPNSDYEKYKQCHTCYNIVPVHTLRFEGSLLVDDTYELIMNPFDAISTPVVTTLSEDRKRDATFKAIVEREYNQRKRAIHPKDREVLKEIDKGNIVQEYHTY